MLEEAGKDNMDAKHLLGLLIIRSAGSSPPGSTFNKGMRHVEDVARSGDKLAAANIEVIKALKSKTSGIHQSHLYWPWPEAADPSMPRTSNAISVFGTVQI